MPDSSFGRRRSSKRKASDRDRGEEIRAMSQSKRASSHSASGQFVKETRRVSGGRGDKMGSDISLPIQESIESSLSGVSDSFAFKVNTFSLYTPRPTLQFAETRTTSRQDDSRASHRKEKQPIPGDDLNAKKRIHELADDLDAGALRELMERDQRRRERKRQLDQEKLQRRLQRRADRDREEERRKAAARIAGEDVLPSEALRGRSTQPVANSPPQKQEKTWLEGPSNEQVATEDPFSDKAEPSDLAADQDPINPFETVGATPPASPKPRHGSSPMPDLTQETTITREETPTEDRVDSGKQFGSWTTFFRRGTTKAKRGSFEHRAGTPSEFSNASRESFGVRHSQPPPQLLANPAFARSAVPKRTLSKFREDLPESKYPISPPESRMQSPEAQMTTPAAERSSYLNTVHDDVESRHRSWETQSPEPSSAILSQSMASVDSEASWLSGKPSKRHSQQPMNTAFYGSESSLGKVHESEDIEDDSVGALHVRRHRMSAQTASSAPLGEEIEDSDLEDLSPQRATAVQESFRQVSSNKPMYVHHGNGAKSTDVLNVLSNIDEPASPSDDEASPTYEVHRATSVDLGKGHVRRISAGSARLLDLKVNDTKRLSSSSRTDAPAKEN